MALWRIPRRSDDSVRVGLNSMVRASSSSKLSNDSGPWTKALITEDFSRVTPGVMSTRTAARTRSGWAAARAMVVSPPSDMPTTARACGAKRRITSATSAALPSGARAPSGVAPGPSE